MVAICLSLAAYAQDVIVKKDGSTISAKITEVNETQVKYKKYANLNGSTYSIAKEEVKFINYENGDRDDFTSSQTNKTPDLSVMTPQQQISDAQLLNTYNKKYFESAKKLKKTAWIGGGILVACGVGGIVAYYFLKEDSADGKYMEKNSTYLYAGIGATVAGGIWWASFYSVAKHKERNAMEYSVNAAPLMQMPILDTKGSKLYTSIDMIGDNYTKDKAIGLGLHLNF